MVQESAAHNPWVDGPKHFVRTVGEFLAGRDRWRTSPRAAARTVYAGPVTVDASAAPRTNGQTTTTRRPRVCPAWLSVWADAASARV